VNRRVLVVVFVGFALACAFFVFTLRRPEPPRSAAPAPLARPAPAPAVKDDRKPEPAPATPAPRTTRRAPVAPAPSAEAPRAAEPAEPAREGAVLRIDSDVPGAQVFIDRVFIGAAPVTARDVTPGSHRINVSAPGYDGVAETVDVASGSRDLLVKLKEVRLDATIAVVHKHRLGSCKGQLIATPRGLRYNTTDKDDGFSAPLTDLETFQVDYLQKLLTLKVQKGKRYEFTDPGGNADRLFVFHRDVEKARDRLKKGDPPAER
jgi:hypothetical protein